MKQDKIPAAGVTKQIILRPIISDIFRIMDTRSSYSTSRLYLTATLVPVKYECD